jgi:branched-chain amino acid transport system substrate-binding protein
MVLLAAGLSCQRSRGPVRIGVAFPTRNTPAIFMAVNEVNARGGIGGRPLTVVLDTIPVAAEPADLEIRRAEYLVSRGVTAVIGHGGSRGSLAAAPVYNESGVVHVVPTGTSRLLANAGAWTLPMPPNDSVEGAFIAEWVRDVLGARTVALFYVNDEYGIGLRDGVKAALVGGPVRILHEQRFDVGSDMAVLTDAVLSADVPDVAVVAGRTAQTAQTAQVARRLAQRRVRTRVMAGDGALTLPDLADLAGEGGDGILVATFWLPVPGDSIDRRFTRQFQQRVGRPVTATDAMLYDATHVLARAMDEAGTEPARVRDYLLSLGLRRPRHRGVTGDIGFGPGAGPPRLVMAEIRGRDALRAGEAP